MGTVSRDAKEPRAGNAGFTDSREVAEGRMNDLQVVTFSFIPLVDDEQQVEQKSVKKAPVLQQKYL